MATDPLYEPLGRDRPAPRSRQPLLAAVACIAVAAVGVAVWTGARQRQAIDRTTVVSTIETAPKPALPAPPASPPEAAPAGSSAKVVTLPPSPPTAGGNTVEMQNGVKIVRFNPSNSAAPLSIPVEAAAAPLARAPDPGLSEKTADGVLPRIGADGRRPGQVYARPAAVSSGPRVGLLLSGMGVDQMATAEAARRLPAEASFAFAPDVPDVQAQAAEARRLGHEVFLDLTASAGSAERLRRQMARVTGYAGVIVSAGDTLASGEAAARGLVAVTSGPDGGSRPTTVPIDAAAGPTAVAAGLETAAARAAGAPVLAIVGHAATALDALGTAAASLGGKGITVVPASAVPGPAASARDAP